MAFLGLKSPVPLFRLIRSGFSPSIKWFLLPDISFSFVFPLFLMFLSSTCSGVWLFVGFFVGDSDGSTASIKQKSHFKSLFISMLHQT